MRICKSKEKKGVQLRKLKLGDVFNTSHDQGQTFMKIEKASSGCNAVDVEKGVLYSFSSERSVVPVQGCFYVEE